PEVEGKVKSGAGEPMAGREAMGIRSERWMVSGRLESGEKRGLLPLLASDALLLIVPLSHLVPVDHVPPRAHVIRAAVLVLEVVGVLPDVAPEHGRLAIHDR